MSIGPHPASVRQRAGHLVAERRVWQFEADGLAPGARLPTEARLAATRHLLRGEWRLRKGGVITPRPPGATARGVRARAGRR